jgi:hypothetical protein
MNLLGKIFQKHSIFLSRPKKLETNFRRFFTKKSNQRSEQNRVETEGFIFEIPRLYGLKTTLALAGVCIFLKNTFVQDI